jgi:RHS repeat-associated protein
MTGCWRWTAAAAGRARSRNTATTPWARRVWVRTAINCQPSTSLECGTSAVQRTLWDGSAEAAEIRAPYDAGNPALEETDSGLASQPPAYYGDVNAFFGRVVYAPGLAVDEPLSVTRYAYQDRVVGLTGTSILQWPTFTLVPFYDYRSTPVWGMYANGALSNPYASGGSDCPPPAAGGTERCVLLSWPFAGNAWNKARGGGLIYSWHGSIIATKRDGSGLHYMRNRVYDPGTGRFTQEDPIGLAGGLNTYGFAGGDPRNSSDPFGLCPPKTLAEVFQCTGELLRPAQRPLEVLGTLAMLPLAGGGAVEGIAGDALMIGRSFSRAASAVRAGAGAESATLALQLNKALASEAQMGEAGVRIAGPGTRAAFRDAARAAKEYGGRAEDWAKMSSSQHVAADGARFETHWLQNVVTGVRAEFKTIFK